jgi:hypothetical protein
MHGGKGIGASIRIHTSSTKSTTSTKKGVVKKAAATTTHHAAAHHGSKHTGISKSTSTVDITTRKEGIFKGTATCASPAKKVLTKDLFKNLKGVMKSKVFAKVIALMCWRSGSS